MSAGTKAEIIDKSNAEPYRVGDIKAAKLTALRRSPRSVGGNGHEREKASRRAKNGSPARDFVHDAAGLRSSSGRFWVGR